jgi:hypothetical protein
VARDMDLPGPCRLACVLVKRLTGRSLANQRLERTGEQPCRFMRAAVVAGRSTAGRWAAGDK